MLGLLSHYTVETVGHSLFNNFKLALSNIFEKNNFKEIKNADDLKDISHLFIIDEHYEPNSRVWANDKFIGELNNRRIKTIVFNFEPIKNSFYPYARVLQAKLLEIKHLVQIIQDVNDFEIFESPFLNKQLLSKDTVLIESPCSKSDKVLFIGQCRGEQYFKRRQTIQEVSKYFEIELIVTDRVLSYNEFLQKLASFKYVLNPLGIGDFLNLRYFEILKLNSLPIQQSTQKMIENYEELNRNFSINFINPEELKEIKLSDFKQNKESLYLEDYLLNNGIKEIL
jgi:hypothetical protein